MTGGVGATVGVHGPSGAVQVAVGIVGQVHVGQVQVGVGWVGAGVVPVGLGALVLVGCGVEGACVSLHDGVTLVAGGVQVCRGLVVRLQLGAACWDGACCVGTTGAGGKAAEDGELAELAELERTELDREAEVELSPVSLTDWAAD